MPKAKWRVIYNQDCTNLFYHIDEPLKAEHVDGMIDEVAEAGVELMLINPNAQKVCYPSRVWPTYWDGFVPGDRNFFKGVPEDQVDSRLKGLLQMRHLAESGCDYLARSLERCRKRGITPGISMRMNDMHDVPWPESPSFSPFYKAHPEWHLKNSPASQWGGSGLNFVHAPVREHCLTLIREWCRDYSFDVLELDFMRFQCYFPDGEGRQHAPILTEFLRDVKRELAATGRQIALIPRVATTPDAAWDLGMDVATWAREGLIDGLTFGAFFTMAWNRPIDAFREAVGADVALYPSSEAFVDSRYWTARRNLPTDPAWVRGFAAASLAGGADGVYMFNFFVPRDMKLAEPICFDVLRSVRSADLLRGLSKKYTLSTTASVKETDGVAPLPVDLPNQQERSFKMALAAEPAGVTAMVHLFVIGPAGRALGGLLVSVNQAGLAVAREPVVHPVGTDGKAVCQELVYPLDMAVVRDGWNHFVVRNEGDEVSVMGLDVVVSGVKD
jgi:hypothetical protein